MNVKLLFPPSGDVFQPYSSITHLTAILTKETITVEQRDLNIEFFNHFVSPELTKKNHRKLEVFLKQFEEQGESSVFDAALYQRYVLYRDQKDLLLKSVDAISQIKNGFECYKTIHECIQLVEEVLTFNSFPYFPTRVLLGKGCENNLYSYEQAEEIISFTQNTKANPYYAFYKQVLPSLIEGTPDVIAISICFNTQILAAFSLIKEIRDSGFRGHITVGGPAMTQLETRLPDFPRLMSEVDSAIIGEGDYALPELVKTICSHGDLSRVSNLFYWDKNRTKLIYSRYKSHVQDMNQMVPPSLAGLDMTQYLSPETVLLYAPTRGCYWSRCAFCSYGLTSGTTTKYRERSVNLIVDDLAYLHRTYNINYFTFSVDCIAPQTLAEISAQIIARKLPIYWQADLRLESQITRERIELFAKAGCVSIMFGLESGCQRVLDAMDKGIRIETARRIFKQLMDAGIGSVAMVICGFPTETEAEADITKEFLIQNFGAITSVGLGVFGLLRNSKVAKCPESYAVDSINQPTKADLGFEYPDYSTSEGMTSKEKHAVYNRVRKELAAYYPLDHYPFAGQGQSGHTLLWLHRHGPSFARELVPGNNFIAPIESTIRQKTDESDLNVRQAISMSPCTQLVNSPFDLLSFPDMPDSISPETKDEMYQSYFTPPSLVQGEKIFFQRITGDFYRFPKIAADILLLCKKPKQISDVLELTANISVQGWLQRHIKLCLANGLLTLVENADQKIWQELGTQHGF